MKEEGKKEETKKKNKKVKASNVKMAVLSAGKRITKIALMLILIIIFLVGGCYVIKHNDAVFAESDKKNTPYMVSTYTNSVTIDEDGKITTEMTPQELWDEMIKNGNRVDEYLDSPEELAKLMNAQLITQYMDTRSEDKIEEDIDWDSINEDVDTKSVQGIIKMKRSDTNGNVSRMTYAEPYMLYGWIEEYNTSGSEEAKQKLLTHFTLEQRTTTASGSGGSIVTSGKVADVSAAIVNEATKKNTYGLGSNVCQTWVGKVYEAAGFGYTPSGCCAYLAGQKWGVSSDFSQIVNGAAVWTGSGSYRGTQCSTHRGGGCGHAGIYYKDENGNDWVLNLVGGKVKQDTLEHWLEYYGAGNTPVWGWQGGLQVQMEGDVTSINSNGTTSDTEATSKTVAENVTSTTSLNNFLFIGDSILYSIADKVEAEGATTLYQTGAPATFFLKEGGTSIPNTEVYNTETNCKRTTGNKFDWDANLSGLNPSGIYLILGQNGTGSKAAENIETLVSELQEQFQNIPIYINSIIPAGSGYSDSDSYNSAQKQTNELLKTYCASANNVTYVNTLNGYMDESGCAKADVISSDDFHPNSSGQEILFNNIKNGITGSSSSSSSSGNTANGGSGACALVATWNKVEYGETSNDPDAEYENKPTEYNVTTTPVYYQNMVSGYTMPFNYLWALLVITEDIDYVMELADLVYGSEIELTVYDNLTVNTQVETINYNRYRSVQTYAKGTFWYSPDVEGGEDSDVEFYQQSPAFYHTYTTITTTNTLNVILSTADVWMLKYTQEYTNNNTPKETNSESEPNSLENIDIATNLMNYDESFPYGIKNLNKIEDRILSRNGADSISWTRVKHTYTERLINRIEIINTTTKTTGYVSSPANVEEKTDKNSEEPNFVTIFLKYREAKNAILELDEWLFEILKDSKDTSDLLDLTKYMIYKAIGKDYGVTEYDFEEFKYSSFNMTTNIVGNEIKEKVWNALKGLGYTDIAVAGAMGNIDYESGGFSPTMVEKGSGEGIGLIQWSFGRRNQLETYAVSKGVSWTDEDTQIEFLIAEISGQGPAAEFADVRKSGYIKEEKITSTSNDWANSTTIEDATLHFMRFFESPKSTSSYSERLERAIEAYNIYHK